jgi:hypothetical protein
MKPTEYALLKPRMRARESCPLINTKKVPGDETGEKRGRLMIRVGGRDERPSNCRSAAPRVSRNGMVPLEAKVSDGCRDEGRM